MMAVKKTAAKALSRSVPQGGGRGANLCTEPKNNPREDSVEISFQITLHLLLL